MRSTEFSGVNTETLQKLLLKYIPTSSDDTSGVMEMD